jgi:collagenase-like PrtC family protease
MEKNIGFHLPGLLKQHSMTIALQYHLDNHPEMFHDGVYIASLYGTYPTSVWNGGRFMQGLTDERTVRLSVEILNEKGIPVRFTFTNPVVTEEELSDRFCNRTLEIADNGMNEVIVNSPLLEKYIREKYPNYKITSSTCKQIENADDLNAELKKDYNLVVLDYNWNHDIEFLKSIDQKERCELLVNACCIPHCPRRGEHYRQIGEEQNRYWTEQKNHVMKIVDYHDFPCQYMKNTIYDTVGYETRILPDDLYETYVPMGFKHFKIEGRTVPLVETIDTVVQYMAKAEYRDYLRLKLTKFVFNEA